MGHVDTIDEGDINHKYIFDSVMLNTVGHTEPRLRVYRQILYFAYKVERRNNE